MPQSKIHRSFDQLRRCALEELAKKDAKKTVGDGDGDGDSLAQLLFELDTYQIELELQNDQLQLAELELREAHEVLNELYDFAPVGYMTLDDDGCIVRCNITFADMLGLHRSDVQNKPLTNFVCSEDQDLLYLYYRTMKLVQHRLTRELRFQTFVPSQSISCIPEDRSYFWAQMDAVANPSSDTKETGRTYKVIVLDIAERKKNEQRIQEQEQVQKSLLHDLAYKATHDNLTDLVNRHEFELRLQRLLETIESESRPAEHVLCFLDLDQFKIVNDSCGHLAGDELLKQLSQLMVRSMRQRDTFARLGGDEFGILMEHCTLEQAHSLLENLRQVIESFQFSWNRQTFKVSASFGVVRISKQQNDKTTLLRNADQACYLAKETGRNRLHFYDTNEEDTEKRLEQVSWNNRIIKALEANRFELVCQSIVPINPQKQAGPHLELLIRMLDIDNTYILPGAFLGAAERFHLAIAIDTWVVQHLFRQLKSTHNFNDYVSMIHINISAMSLVSSSFLKLVLTELDNAYINPEKICFEITETAAISNMNEALNFMTQAKKIGCKFALDDFGIGLSSFAYLKKLPVDYLKIDGIFVRGITQDSADYATVKSINEIGHAMGKKTVAEYVENEATLLLLKEIGVDFVQGNYLGKPEPIIQYIDRFTRH